MDIHYRAIGFSLSAIGYITPGAHHHRLFVPVVLRNANI